MMRYVRRHQVRRGVWRLLLCALAGAAVGLLAQTVASGQTAPAGFCGFASVATPVAPSVTNGAAVNASQSVANTTASAAPTIPTLTAGNIVGALVYVEQTGIRYRVDGTSPSGTFDGSPLNAGQTASVCGSDMLTWRAIASSTGPNAILRWNFYTTGR